MMVNDFTADLGMTQFGFIEGTDISINIDATPQLRIVAKKVVLFFESRLICFVVTIIVRKKKTQGCSEEPWVLVEGVTSLAALRLTL